MLPIVRLLGLLAILLLVGCETIHYEYRPPVTEQGRFCVTQCGAIKEICKGNEIRRAQSEKEICERSNDSNYRACMRNAKNKEQEKSCDSKKKHCWGSENFYGCEADYRQCFVNCGGSIREHRK